MLQIQFSHALAFAQLFLAHVLSLHRGFDCHGLHDTNDLLGDGGVHTNTAKYLAALKPELDSLFIATINRTAAPLLRVRARVASDERARGSSGGLTGAGEGRS